MKHSSGEVSRENAKACLQVSRMGRAKRNPSCFGEEDARWVSLRSILRARAGELRCRLILRHCEERSDEAIQTVSAVVVWIASAFAKASADKSLRSQ